MVPLPAYRLPHGAAPPPRLILASEILISNAVTCDLYDARIRVADAIRVLSGEVIAN